MSMTFDPYTLKNANVTSATSEVLMTNPTATTELERFWGSLPRKNGVPLRKDVDPSKMGPLLADSFILERVAPGVARIRVAGRSVGRLLGIEPRGLPLTAAFLPTSRVAISQYIESAFTGPSIVELSLIAPRAVGQPKLNGKILLLPLRDEMGRVNRMLGVLVMSGRLGSGGRRFDIDDQAAPRVEPISNLTVVEPAPRVMPALRPVQEERKTETSKVEKTPAPRRPSLLPVADIGPGRKKAQDKPALRLVVCND